MTTSEIDTFGMSILCIDDSRTQLALYREELEGMYRVSCAETYEEAIASLTAIRPDLILLDMSMPRVSGLEFLDILRFAQNYRNIPVIIVSGDSDPAHVKEAFRRNAADYVRKPYDSEELMLRINRLFQLLAGPCRDAAEGSGSLSTAQELLIQSLAELSSAKDNENTKHLVRIGQYAEELSRAAAKTPRFRAEINDDFIVKIASMARLHDIGKVNVPDFLLSKPEALSEREFESVKRHTVDGARTVDMIRLSFPNYAFLDFAHDIVLFHHERWNGSGYPEGRAALSIPLSSR